MGGEGEFSVDFPGVGGGRFVVDNQGNIKSRGNITAAGRNILGEIDELKNKPAVAGSTDFDAFTNGNDAKFSLGWKVGADWPWDPSIRGPGRGGFAHTENKDNLGDDQNDNNSSNRTADIAVPAGMKSGFLFHLPWSNCRHFDIWGVLANGQEVFVRRVNAFQNVRNEQKDNFHDAAAVVPITRVDRFAHIRIKGVRGRIHYMGTGWTKNNLDSYASGADSGFVSAQNIVGISDYALKSDLMSFVKETNDKVALKSDLSTKHICVNECGNIRSPNGRFYVGFNANGDGLLSVARADNGTQIWNNGSTPGTSGAPYKLYMQGDGNLVIYNKNGAPTWASNTDGKGRGPYKLYLDDNGKLSIIDGTELSIWGLY